VDRAASAGEGPGVRWIAAFKEIITFATLKMSSDHEKNNLLSFNPNNYPAGQLRIYSV
jgi:hypothetical protein